jgi:uroporphyrinogen-III synthase
LRVLVTRPRFDAARTAEKLSVLGHEAVIDSVIEIEALPFDPPSDGFSAIIFTSANAARIAASHESLKRLPVFAVGERTGEAARELGFQRVRVAGGDVIALGGLIASDLPGGAKILHLAGEDRAGDLPGRLAQSGITVETRINYRARASAALRPETASALRESAIDAVLHYSERSAAVFVRLAETAGISGDIRKTRHLCLSSAVAAPLKSFGARTEIAAAPDEEALLALLDR